MILTGRINDPVKNTILQNATVSIVDSLGKEKGIATTTNEVGAFTLNNATITTSDKIKVTHPDYKDTETPVTGQRDYGFIPMTLKDPVTQTKSATDNNSNAILIFGSIGALLLLAGNNNKKKVAGFSQSGLVILGAAALGFFLLGKKEDTPTPENQISDLPNLLPEQSEAVKSSQVTNPADYDFLKQ